MTTISPQCQEFRRLHQSGCFVIPNPWDIGSARLLAQLGFRALATTSSGFAWSRGRADNHVSLDETLSQLRSIADAVDVPVNADFEGGFATAPDDVAANVTLAVATGIAGLSIEDSTGDAANPLFEFALAVDRIRAARQAIDQAALASCSPDAPRGSSWVDRTWRRQSEGCRRMPAAGADCLYAPGIRSPAEIVAVVNAVAPKPVNVLVGSDFTTVSALAEVGVRRISVGGALARAAWAGFLDGGAGNRRARDVHELWRAPCRSTRSMVRLRRGNGIHHLISTPRRALIGS